MQKMQIPVAAEGVPFILFSAFVALVSAMLELVPLALLFVGVTAFVLYFFRDPVRITPQDAGAIIAPADGKVIIVQEVDDKRFLETRVIKISIFMNVFNVHVNRIPLAGQVEKVQFVPGRFYAADKEKAELHNEYCAVTLTTANKQKYTVVQVAGLIARRIVCRATPGDTLAAGERYGLIRFGSRLDLYLPTNSTILVKPGDIVQSGESVLGHVASTTA